MAHLISDIAAALGAEAFGNVTLAIERVAEPATAGPDELALATDAKYAADLAKGQARAAMLWPGADWEALGLEAAIIAPRPRYAMSGLTAMLDPGQGIADGVHPSAVVDADAQLGSGVTVGPLAVISAGARIGAGSVIGPQCFVGRDAGSEISPSCASTCRIGARVRIGDRFIAAARRADRRRRVFLRHAGAGRGRKCPCLAG